jgi:hypothetical protein
MTPKPSPRQRQPSPLEDAEDWPVDRGRPWLLRLLALVGALAFVMLGLNSLFPLLQQPMPMPDQRDRTVT